MSAGEAGIMSYNAYNARPLPRASTPIQEMDVEAFATYKDISSMVAAGSGIFPESLDVSTGRSPSSPRASSLLWSAPGRKSAVIAPASCGGLRPACLLPCAFTNFRALKPQALPH